MKMTRAVVACAMLLAAGTACCEEFSALNAEKLNLTREFAIKMALNKNIDLGVEALNSSLAATDAARSRAIYDTILSASANGGMSYIPGDPFFLTKNSTSSLGVTQYLPTGGSIAASVQSGFTTAETGLAGSAATDWQSSVGITVTQPLLKNAGKETMELGITLADTTLLDSRERFRAATSDTVLAVISSYNHLYALRQTLEARTAALQSAQALLDEINKRPKSGSLKRMEVANTEYAIAQRRKELVEAERSVSDQEAGLRYLIGVEARIKLIPIEPPSRAEPKESVDQAVKAAMEYRPDLKQLRLALKSSELQERVARHQMLPDLFLVGSGGYSGTSGTFGSSIRQVGDSPARFWSAGLQFNLPLGNTAAENDYRRNKIRTEQIQKQITSLAWRIRNEVEADMRALISARLQLQMVDNSVQFAVQRLEEYRKNNRLGTATVQDVLNAENDLTFARTAHMDASETFAYNVAKLWRDIGVLLDRLGVPGELLPTEKTAVPRK